MVSCVDDNSFGQIMFAVGGEGLFRVPVILYLGGLSNLRVSLLSQFEAFIVKSSK